MIFAGFVALPPQRLFDYTFLMNLASRLVAGIFDGGCDILLRVTVPSISTDGSVFAVVCGVGGRALKTQTRLNTVCLHSIAGPV
jgi:hypothetical protein